MNSLYDILGIGRLATATQIEQGYRHCLDALADEENSKSPTAGMVRAQAIKEAYSVLSSPTRRLNYDSKLKGSQQVSYEVVESRDIPWTAVLLLAVALIAGGAFYYKAEAEKTRLAALTMDAAKAKSEAERAELVVAAEREVSAREKQLQDRRADEARLRETEQARREGQQIHEQNQQFAARSAREKEQAERQAKLEKEREERDAQNRSRNESAAMQRALSIPIRRY